MKKYFRDFLLSVLAGFSIGLGGTVFLRIKDAFAGGSAVGAVLFTIGLFVICTREYNLFTGKACFIFDNKPGYLLRLAVILLGNTVGCMLIAGLEGLTVLCGSDSGINVTAREMVSSKMSAPLLSLFILGILCNVCIYIAVSGYAKCVHGAGKYLSLFLGVCVFILSGTEHSIADIYYWCVSGVLYEETLQSILRIAVIAAGNVVGGVFLPVTEKICGKLE